MQQAAGAHLPDTCRVFRTREGDDARRFFKTGSEAEAWRPGAGHLGASLRTVLPPRAGSKKPTRPAGPSGEVQGRPRGPRVSKDTGVAAPHGFGSHTAPQSLDQAWRE